MINVTAAIIEEDGRVLAARRKPDAHLAGYWEFPGGKIVQGESAEHCLRRELAEEFGIDTAIGPFVGENIHDYGDKRVRLRAYRVAHIAGEFCPVDHDALQWLMPAELHTLDWAPADIPLVEHYQALASTERYYEANAQAYQTNTQAIDLNYLYAPFLDHLPLGGHILDLGCGTGRDSRAFIDRGFRVTALDGSAAMARIAEQSIGQPVLVQDFQDLNAVAVFDGVWACASLLHCSPAQFERVMRRVVAALVPGGVGFLSLKWGEGEAIDDKGRYFQYYTEQRLDGLLKRQAEISKTRYWESRSVAGGGEQRWLNVLFHTRDVQL